MYGHPCSLYLLLVSPFLLARAGIPRDWIIQCFNTIWGRNCAFYFLGPLLSPKRRQSSAQPENMLCLGRFQKGRPFWVPIWVFALLQNSQVATLASFRPSPTRHSLPDSWNVREILGVVVCPIGPGFSQSLRFWGPHALGMCLPAWISAPSRSVSVRNPT